MSRESFVDCLRETDARTDPNFSHYRVETESLRRLADFKDRAFIAVGLKGVGKTAAFRSLQDIGDVDVAYSICPETHSVDDQGVSKPTLQYVPDIKSEIILQILVSVREGIRSGKISKNKVPDDIQHRINVILVDLAKKLKSAIDELGGVQILGIGFTRRTKSKSETQIKLVQKADLKEIERLAGELLRHVNVRVVIDDPEAVFSSEGGLNSKFLTALALASHELSKKFDKLKCIVLLKPNILRALRKVDEFVNIPIDCRVRLCWSNEELKQVIARRADFVRVNLKTTLGNHLDSVFETLIADSRSGPRDILQRLYIQMMAFPGEKTSPTAMERTITKYSEACFEQMYGPYEEHYKGLAGAAVRLFDNSVVSIPKREMHKRFDELIATNSYVLQYKNEQWAKDSKHFSDLLTEFGMVGIQSEGGQKILPFYKDYLDEAAKQSAVFIPLPGLRGLSAS
jgi:hypothetical protein